jgi:hypothetical protein
MNGEGPGGCPLYNMYTSFKHGSWDDICITLSPFAERPTTTGRAGQTVIVTCSFQAFALARI